MIIKGIQDEDFVNYKLPSMVVLFPKCTFKCDKECGEQVCHNSKLATATNVNIGTHTLMCRYMRNPITQALVCAGLEPFDSFDDLIELIKAFRWEYSCNDAIVIYTGYTKEEISDKVNLLLGFDNIIIKYGRFVPDQIPHTDPLLGVKLASDNQYAEYVR